MHRSFIFIGLLQAFFLHAATLETMPTLEINFDGNAEAAPDTFRTRTTQPESIKYSSDAVFGKSLDLSNEGMGYISVRTPPHSKNFMTISMWIKLPKGSAGLQRGIFSWGRESARSGAAHGLFLTGNGAFMTVQDFGMPSEVRNIGRACPMWVMPLRAKARMRERKRA